MASPSNDRSILKFVVMLGIALNVVFAGYNGLTRWRGAGAQDRLDGTKSKVIRIKELVLAYKGDLDSIKSQKMVLVKHAGRYFANQARLASFRDTDEMTIPGKVSEGRAAGNSFNEESWKITFKKEKYYSLKQIARFCELIETGAPRFQIKEIDMGQRINTWGADQWKAKHVTVRRLTPRTKRTSRSSP